MLGHTLMFKLIATERRRVIEEDFPVCLRIKPVDASKDQQAGTGFVSVQRDNAIAKLYVDGPCFTLDIY